MHDDEEFTRPGSGRPDGPSTGRLLRELQRDRSEQSTELQALRDAIALIDQRHESTRSDVAELKALTVVHGGLIVLLGLLSLAEFGGLAYLVWRLTHA